MYVVSRLSGLLSVPIFLDEAIHIKSARAAAAGDLATGADLGKWLSIQTYGLVQRVFGDSLLVARLVPLVLGVLTLSLLFALDRKLGLGAGTPWAAPSALLYAVVPLSFFYDRVALTDQFLVTLLALIMLLTYRVLENKKAFDQLALGVAILASPFFKFSGLLLVPVPAIIALVGSDRRASIRRLGDLWPSYALSIPGILLFVLLAAPGAESGKLVGAGSASAWMGIVARNARDLLSLLASMLTPGLLLVVTMGSIVLLFPPTRETARRRVLAHLAVAVLVTAPFMLFFDSWYPRYLLPLLVPFCLIGGEVSALFRTSSGESRGAFKSVVALAPWLLALALAAARSMFLLIAPQTSPFDPRIRSQFVTGWTSGYGLEDAITTLRRISSRQSNGLRVLRPPWEDVPLHGLDVYAHALPSQIEIVTLFPWETETIQSRLAAELSDDKPTCLLFNSAHPYPGDREVFERIPASFEVFEIAHFVKPDSHPGLRIWRLDGNLDGPDAGERTADQLARVRELAGPIEH